MLGHSRSRHKAEFCVVTVYSKGREGTKAFVIFMDGPHVGQMGDYTIRSVVKENECWVGEYSEIPTLERPCGILEIIG